MSAPVAEPFLWGSEKPPAAPRQRRLELFCQQWSRSALEQMMPISFRATEVYDDGALHPDGTWEPRPPRYSGRSATTAIMDDPAVDDIRPRPRRLEWPSLMVTP